MNIYCPIMDCSQVVSKSTGSFFGKVVIHVLLKQFFSRIAVVCVIYMTFIYFFFIFQGSTIIFLMLCMRGDLTLIEIW